jgi:hypothetical protein
MQEKIERLSDRERTVVEFDLEQPSREFYSKLALASAAVMIPLGYLSLFSIGLLLLGIAVITAALGWILFPSKSRLVIGAIEASAAVLPLVVLVGY